MHVPTEQTSRDNAPDLGAESSSSGRSWFNGPYRAVRRIGVAVVGSTVLVVGIVFLVTPGPAFVVIPVGLGILSLEFEWARRWLAKVKEHVAKVMPSRDGKDSAAPH